MTLYTEEDLLPLSALQHLLFCQRQCALIHVEQAWGENLFTAQGRIMHERVDGGGRESRGKVKLAFGLPLHSFRLGLVGKADAVEFHQDDAGDWHPFPVEHKLGRPKKADWDKVQLCAQALCLEEMLGCSITSGALFYGKTRRRQDVVFDPGLRRQVEDASARLHKLVRAGRTPSARYEKKCDSCSLVNLCMPKVAGAGKKVEGYLSRMLAVEGVGNDET